MFTWCVMSGLISPGFFPLLTIMFLCWSQFNNSNVFPTWQTTYKQNCEFINSASCYYLRCYGHTSRSHTKVGVALTTSHGHKPEPLPLQFLTKPSPEWPPVSSRTCGCEGYEGVWLVWVHIRLNVRSHASSPQGPPWCCLPVARCLRHSYWYLQMLRRNINVFCIFVL